MSDKPARKIMDGRVGDGFVIAKNYEGNYNNAVGIPLNTPHGKHMPIPSGNGPADLTVIERPDFRKVDKHERVHKSCKAFKLLIYLSRTHF
ncbi:unnamed protein product [Caenorhabditis bovis]|uniref:Uncharacterized protein n=1 Tax=Caenorhabditis bovis TaxID=2654633 RepID=A0A8S1EUQ2_9PELO|nr:unnamed protein product [Caenorhabditis bovis]